MGQHGLAHLPHQVDLAASSRREDQDRELVTAQPRDGGVGRDALAQDLRGA